MEKLKLQENNEQSQRFNSAIIPNGRSNNVNQDEIQNYNLCTGILCVPHGIAVDARTKSITKGLQYLELLLETKPFPFSSDYFGTNRADLKSSTVFPQFPFAVKEIFNQYLLLLLLQQHLPSNFRAKLIQKIQPKQIEFMNFFGDVDSLVFPNDSDTTSVCYHSLLNSNTVTEEEITSVAMTMYENTNNDGVIQIYFVPKEDPRYNRSDAVGICNVLMLAYALRHEHLVNLSEDFVYNWLSSGNYKSGTTYYPSPHTFLYMCSRLASINYQTRKRFMPALRQAFLHQNLEVKHPLDYAMKILTGVKLGFRNDLPFKTLMDMQNTDGSWPADAIYSSNHVKIYFGSKAISTMFAVLALIELI